MHFAAAQPMVPKHILTALNTRFRKCASALGGTLSVAMFAMLLFVAVQPAHAQTETVLYSFGEGPAANFPNSNLLAHGDDFYGVTGEGSVYELSPEPAHGCKKGTGTGNGWCQSLLYEFGAPPDGASPWGTLIRDAKGNLYGTTSSGGSGSDNDNGTAFELSPPAKAGQPWTETVLYNFCSQPSCTDGSSPYSGLVMDKSGNLYGTTYVGGTGTACGGLYSPYGCGTVFELSPPAVSGDAWTETVLWSFGVQSGDGWYPYLNSNLVIDKKGNLYGTTFLGGNLDCDSGYGCGAVFELSPPATEGEAWTEAVRWSFAGNGDGAAPYAGLMMDRKGNLYGTTVLGPVSTPGNPGSGTVFELSPPAKKSSAWTETTLYGFCEVVGDCPGQSPESSLVMDTSGNLYGTTPGTYTGTVFELSPASAGNPWTMTLLHAFSTANGDGYNPNGGLVLDKKGNLYGVTYSGGAYCGCGTVYEVTP